MENNLWELIDTSQNILILTHQRPDGDAIGSSLAMYESLISMGKNVTVVMQDVPEVYNFLENYQYIKTDTSNSFELAIVLDCSTKERIGQITDLTAHCQKIVCLDHHINNTLYADVNLIDANASSCCQIVYYFLKRHNITISKTIGESILVGVLTDTNGFSNNNVDSATFKLTAELLDQGLDFYDIYSKVLRMKTIAQFALHKLALSRLEFFESGKIAFTYLNQEDFANTGAKLGDHEGIVDIGRNIENVEVSVFIREDKGYHVSLRSNGLIDVNKIAHVFNGGGHTMAAGCIIEKTFKETKKVLIKEIKNRLV